MFLGTRCGIYNIVLYYKDSILFMEVYEVQLCKSAPTAIIFFDVAFTNPTKNNKYDIHLKKRKHALFQV